MVIHIQIGKLHVRCGTTRFRGTTRFPRLKGRAPLEARLTPTIIEETIPIASPRHRAERSALKYLKSVYVPTIFTKLKRYFLILRHVVL
jgi:hypothetical protein